MFDEQLRARNELILEMKREMLGPGSEPNCIDVEHELVSANPEKRYCIGILFPQGNTFKMEEDDSMGEDSNTKEEIEEDESEEDKSAEKKEDKLSYERSRGKADMEDTMDENISMSTKLLPSSMGITFISDKKMDEIIVDISFGVYRKALVTDCKIRIDDSIADDFKIPEVFSTYFSYDKEKKELVLLAKFEKKQIKYWYDAEQADDGTFKPYAYKMLELLQTGYVREPKIYKPVVSFKKNDYYNPAECIEDSFAKICALRYKLRDGYYSYTIMLVNTNEGNGNGRNSIFQPVIRVSTDENEELKFCEYAKLNQVHEYDEEEKTNSLLYRNKKNYGTGLGTALNWEIDENGLGYVESDFFPQVEVPQMEFKVDSKYEVFDDAFSMKYLSDLVTENKDIKIEKLNSLLSAYEKWIGELKNESKKLSFQYGETAKRHISNCEYCLGRMKKGIEILAGNKKAWDAFQLANRAMYMQRIHIGIQSKFDNVYPDVEPESDELAEILEDLDYCKLDDNCAWRPFQIAFLLMCVNAVINDNLDNSDRNTVDLIWFPTGGGKTEAYLGLTAFAIFFRKLAHLDESGGTTVIMRYTLRLLAAQQFTRAATLICACEYIRKDCNRKRSIYPRYELGDEAITIGLWIGGDHTPNRIKGEWGAKACYDELSGANSKNIDYKKDRYNKFQVLKCPWCGTKLVKDLTPDKKVIGRWGYHLPDGKHFFMSCPQSSCAFESRLPLQVVDEELYANPPTLLFATVDKFAMMPWYSEIGHFFAVNSNNRTPELIIQDELHLISGPLGSMVGIYETIVDYLCSNKGVKPKIIASTATICRAKEQCSSLYNREVFQFPPQGLDEADSFFARAAKLSEKYGRRYIGLLPAGKTKATMEGKVLAALLQLEKERKDSDEVKDCYWTLTTYFNSLKELGKCSTIVQNDVRDNIRRMAHRNFNLNGTRSILRPDELTSRVSTTALNQTLDKLEKVHFSSDPEKKTFPSNILLATNMISVGIDVDRLNLMVMVGQPKLTSEYIQASSRVGRKYPGVVFTMYDSARSRDRSHYEQFKSYHESFYRYVEPTGVTPFSEPARKRALHAVVLSMIRHGLNLPTNEDISKFDKENMLDSLNSISDYIISRMEDINERLTYKVKSEKEEMIDELDLIYEKIDILAQQSHNALEYGNVMGYLPAEDHKRLMKPFGTDESEPYTFDTLTSMRNVDSSVNVNVILLEE
ncbi:MAG: helicase [Lachnospiraceae bacterium]|nr:helicase [Lachnospiraceae bacterium]